MGKIIIVTLKVVFEAEQTTVQALNGYRNTRGKSVTIQIKMGWSLPKPQF